MRVITGTYTGNGVDSRSITGVGFQPELVIILRDDGTQNDGKRGCWRSSAHTGDATSLFLDTLTTDQIQALETDGFQVGTHARVNANGGTYHYIAFRDNGDNNLAVGTYTGNGVDDRNIVISPTFQPDYVFVKGESGAAGVWRSSAQSGDNSDLYQAVAGGANQIQVLNTDGFQVGTAAEVNTNGTTYFYFAMKIKSGSFNVGTFTGNAVDDRNITGIGFQPTFVILDNITTDTANAWVTTSTYTTGESNNIAEGNIDSIDAIQALQSDGFQVGTDAGVNGNTATIAWLAWKDAPSVPSVSSWHSPPDITFRNIYEVVAY